MLIATSSPNIRVIVPVDNARTLIEVVLLGLAHKLLGSEKFPIAWPDVRLTPHSVISPVDIEAVLRTVAFQSTPRAPVGLQGVFGAAMADSGVSNELVQAVGLQ